MNGILDKMNKKIIRNIMGITIFLVVWELLGHFEIIRFLPSLEEIGACFIHYANELPDHIGSSLNIVICGFLIGVGAGIGTGVLLAYSKTISGLFEPIVNLLRPMPVLALIPLFILWFGIGNLSKILLVAFGCWVILVVESATAIRHLDPIYTHAARTLGASKFQLLRTVWLPGIVPGIAAGIRVSVATAFALCVAAEFMGSKAGLGFIIIDARRFIRPDMLFMGIILISLLAFVANEIIMRIERRILRWMPTIE